MRLMRNYRNASILRMDVVRFMTILTVLLTILSAGVGIAKPATQLLWKKAAVYYDQKEYDSATRIYRQLLQQDVDHATIYYNLGNTYYRKGDIPHSILYYQKVLALHPKDADAADNLALAQTKIQNRLTPVQPIFFLRWWHGFLHLLPAAYWAWLTFLIFAGLLAYIYFGKTKKPFPHFGRWLTLIVAIFVLSCCMLYATHRLAIRQTLAVVMKNDAPLYHEATATGTSISVPAGTTVEIRAFRQGYYHVQLPNGAEGWMPQNLLTTVAD